MESDHSDSSAVTLSYEEYCIMNGSLLCLKKDAGVPTPSKYLLLLILQMHVSFSIKFYVSALCVLRMASSLGDFGLLESVLDEGSEVSLDSNIPNRVNSSIAIVTEESAIHDFDLELLDSVPKSVDSVPSVLKYDSLKLRISEIENALGIYQFAFWKTTAQNSIAIISSLCRDVLEISVTEKDFSVVRQLDHRRSGVLLRVSSFIIKDKVLSNADVFRSRGFHVDVA